jgi:hypothetical protein
MVAAHRGSMSSTSASRPATPDPRRAAAESRLERTKRGILVASAGIGVLVWSLVAGATAISAGNTTPATPASQLTQPARDRFFSNAGSSGISRSQVQSAPILRSHGS